MNHFYIISISVIVAISLFLLLQALIRLYNLNLQLKQKIDQEQKLILQSNQLKKNLQLLTHKLKDTQAKLRQVSLQLDNLNQILLHRELELSELKKKLKQDRRKISLPPLPPLPKTIKEILINALKEIQETKQRLDQEKEKNYHILNNLPYGLLILDSAGKFLFVNLVAQKLLKLPADLLVNKSLDEFLSDKNLNLQKLAKTLFEIKNQKEITLGQTTLKIQKQDLILDGHLQGSVITLYDATREKFIENLKTEFVSLVAHQLRTPLSGIKWALELLIKQEAGPISEGQKQLLEKTYLANERMIRLINQLLELTRLEAGHYLQNLAVISLEYLIDLAIKALEPMAQQKSIKLFFIKPTENLPQVKIDPEKIRMVIENLVRNAIQYTMPGGKVTISLKYVKKGVECSVSDTGIGIPASVQNRIFSRFFRAKNALRLVTEGSGLGLYLSKNIIEAHGGRIWFESNEGKGSTFSFWLPA